MNRRGSWDTVHQTSATGCTRSSGRQGFPQGLGLEGLREGSLLHPLIRCTLAERLDLVLALKNLFIAPAPYKLQPYNKSLKVFIPPCNKSLKMFIPEATVTSAHLGSQTYLSKREN